MSGPSSEGRPSVSSEPSAASSRTLHSRDSRTEVDNGGGGNQSHQPSAGFGRSGTQHGAFESQSGGSGSSLAGESIEEQDFGHRRQRVRRSGGFLLDSTFPSGPRARHSYNRGVVEDKKGKKSWRHSRPSDGEPHLGIARSVSPSRSPLSRELHSNDRNASDRSSRIDPTEAQEQENVGLRIEKRRNRPQEIRFVTHDKDSGSGLQSRLMIDPNQLVHMALNLSESRRRSISSGQLLTPQPRAPSGIQQDGSFRNYGAGSSLRQYLNEQRRVSRNISPIGRKGSPSDRRHMSISMQRSGSLAMPGGQFNPSDATLARRDKAQAYLELRIEYLRLLEYLPPLKPDSHAPGNFFVSTMSVPGSPHPQLSRTPSHAGKQHELGRSYNPLQYIRNRRTRARERKTLDHAPEEFADPHEVREWVDRVEEEARRPGYRQQDRVLLPKIREDHPVTSSPSKPPRPQRGWIFTPEELLADAHWLEQSDNKIVIEDRHGRKIFPPKAPNKQDLLSPRESKEYPDKRRRSWVEGVPGLVEPATGDESEQGSERGRKRRLLPQFRSESPRIKRHGRGHSRLRSDDTTDSSDSDLELGKRKSRLARDVNNNTGPLELRIRELMEEEAKMTHSKSPVLITPDTPNKWGREHVDVPNNKASGDSLEVPGIANGSAKRDTHQTAKVPPKQRTNVALSIDPVKEPRSSFEDLDSTAPSTPNHIGHFPHIGSDFSPPPSRGDSESKRPKKSKLDIFHTHEVSKDHKHEQKQEPDSAGTDRKRNSRMASEEPSEGNGLGIAILAAPGAVKSLLGHRKNDSVSSLISREGENRKDNKESRDPSSAVTRFFKGVKQEGSKVGEFIFRKDRLPEDSETDTASEQHTANESDTEGSSKLRKKARPGFNRSSTATTIGSITLKQNGRYHLDLPSFRSSNVNQTDDDAEYTADTDHHITRQARARAGSRSPRFDRLAPPRMDLRSISATSSINSLSPTVSQDRMAKVLAQPGGVGQGGLPHTGLANPRISVDPSGSPSRHRSSSRPTLDGKRHWSIADGDGNVIHRKPTSTVVTEADIARVRALFYCSGVKAKEIARRAYAKRDPPPFLTRAAEAAKTELIPVLRKEEHVLAARILVRNIEASTLALDAVTEEFRDSTVADMTSIISTLKSRVESDLLPRVRDGGDEAVRITTEVSGSAPLQVKQVSDEIDKLLRMRRRRTRWIRRVGWMLVEWMLLGVMWWVWLVVVVVGFVKRVAGVGWGLLRWLLWL